MSDKVLLQEAMRRRAVFNNLEQYLARIKQVVKGLDEEGEVYLFGSVVEGEHTLSSGIDVLIVTEKNPFQMRVELWRAGITDPFELHIHSPAGGTVEEENQDEKGLSCLRGAEGLSTRD